MPGLDRSQRRAKSVPCPIAGACAALMLAMAGVSAAQTPFEPAARPRGGGFTLPQLIPEREGGPGPNQPGPARSPFDRAQPRGGEIRLPQPGAGPPRPGAPGLPPLPPLPEEETPMRPGGPGPPALGPRAPTRAPSMLPEPLPPGPLSERSAELPPRPRVAPPLSAAPTAPAPGVHPVVLRPGLTVSLRVRQVLPVDGLVAGERLLNSRPPIQPGDRFLAELIEPRPPYPVLIGGTITRIAPPGHFGRPGHVSIQMAQLVRGNETSTDWAPWRMDLVDRRFATKMRRALLATLLTVEGAAAGASIGTQFGRANMVFIGGGLGIGALVGLGYATLRPGNEASFEPGDTFEVTVGATHYRPVPREWQTVLYPAVDANAGKPK